MTKHNIDIIGSTEHVDFPELGLFNVPAKTDTGADSSSVWASDIEVTPDGLRFVLFGPGSQFYTGEPQITTTYRSTSVKNSFGVIEFRYKACLLLKIGKRSVRVWFTLSDRSGMRYPVLLGRRSLKNKFLVDVSQSQSKRSADNPKRVLLLSASNNGQGIAAQVTPHLTKGATVVGRTYAQLSFSVQTNQVVVRETVTGEDIANFDLVYFKSHETNYEFAIAAAAYLQFKHVPFFDEELGHHVSYDKLSEAVTLALHGIPVPQSFCAKRDALEPQILQVTQELGFPLVCKEVKAEQGRKNYLIQTTDDLRSVLEQAKPKDTFLLQAYVPNNGYLRINVFGAKFGPVISRSPVKHTDPLKAHLNKPTGGENATLMSAKSVPSAASDIAVRAARLMNRQVAGVDLIQDASTQQWFVLEVNYAPQLYGGGHTAEKHRALARFLDLELNR